MDGPNPQYDGLTAFAPITREATSAKKGLMSAADKAKLDGLAATVNLLDFQYSLDQFNNTPIAAGTWTGCHPVQNFTYDNAANWFAVEVKLGLLATATAWTHLAVRVSLDSGSINVSLGNGVVPAANAWGTVEGGAFFVPPGIFTAGSHTIEVQLYTDSVCNAYLRCASNPNTDFLTIRILEFS